MDDGACMVIDDSKYSLVLQKKKNVEYKVCFGNSSTFKGSHNALSVTYSKYVSVIQRVSHISSL